jgi:NitT/TauT family transport system substrate-binding protein
MDRRLFLGTTGSFVLFSAWSQASAAERVRFVQSDFGFLFFPAMVAHEIGAFEREGIAAEFIVNLGGAEALAAVVGGNAEVCVGAVSSALRAREKGTDAVVFGTVVARYASNVVLSDAFARKAGVTATSSLKDKAAAMKGATCAVIGLGSGTHQLVLYLAKLAGIDTTQDMKIIATAATAVMPAYTQGRIDAFAVSSPLADEAMRQSGGIWVFNGATDVAADLTDFPYVGLVSREAWLKEKPALARSVARAVNAGLAAMHDPKQSDGIRDKLFEKYLSKGDKSLFNQVWAASPHIWPDTTVTTPAMAKKVLNFLGNFSGSPISEDLVRTGFDYSIGTGV